MKDQDKIKFIEKISKLRNDNNLSARKLSIQIGKNYGYINKLEHDKNFLPTIDTLFDILETCNTTPAEFFYYDQSQYKNDKEIIELLSRVDDDTKNAIIALLKKIKK